MAVIDNVVCGINDQMVAFLNNPSESSIYGLAELRRDREGFRPYILDASGNGKYIGIDTKNRLSWFWLMNFISSNEATFEDERDQNVNCTIVCYYSTKFYKERAYNIGMQVLGSIPDWISPAPYGLSMTVIKAGNLMLDQTLILQNYYGMDTKQAEGMITNMGVFAIHVDIHITYSVNCNPFC